MLFRSYYFSKLFAINPDGTLKWEVELNGYVESSMIVITNKGNIFIGTVDYDSGYIYIINTNGIILKYYNSPNYVLNGLNASIDVNSNLFIINGTTINDTPDNNILLIIDTEENIIKHIVNLEHNFCLYSVPIFKIGRAHV